jgi:hypothetical protein
MNVRSATRFAVYFAISLVLCSFRWPVDITVLTATFGESRYDHYHNGIDLGGGEQDIYPVSEGRIIYREEEHTRTDGFPAGLGSFMVIEHDRGLRTLYAHIKADTMTESLIASESEPIGVIGDTGGSYGKHLHLTVIDREFDQFVNPLLLLPPVLDTSDPIIRGLYMLQDGEMLLVSDDSVVRPGQKELFVEAHDFCDNVSYYCPTAPYQIDVFVNGSELAHRMFEILRIDKETGELLGYGGMEFQNAYADEWLYRIGVVDIGEGTVEIEIVVKDFAGNRATSIYEIPVVTPRDEDVL